MSIPSSRALVETTPSTDAFAQPALDLAALDGQVAAAVAADDALGARASVSRASFRYVTSTSVASRDGAKTIVWRPLARNDRATSRAEPRADLRMPSCRFTTGGL